MGTRFTLETDRLLLPPIGLEHAAELSRVYSDPEVARYIGGASLDERRTTEQLLRFVAQWDSRGVGQSAVFEKWSGRMIGRIGLHYWQSWDEVEIGYVLEAAAQGKGYAGEGAQRWLDWAQLNLDIDHLIAVIAPENKASAKLAERLGFEMSRREVLGEGETVNIYRRDLRRFPQSRHH